MAIKDTAYERITRQRANSKMGGREVLSRIQRSGRVITLFCGKGVRER